MADRFWVGNGGNWSDATNHWATSSGGAPGAGNLPTSADNVYFDALSFSLGSQTVTVDAAANCLDMDWTGATNTPAFIMPVQELNIYGSLTFISAMTMTSSGDIFMQSTSTGKTIITGGLVIGPHFNIVGIGGGWTLQDGITMATNRDINHQGGTLNTNSKPISTRDFNFNTNGVRVLTLSASVITLSRNWTASGSNSTLSANTAIIKVGTIGTFAGNNLVTYNEVQLNGTAHTISGSNTFKTLVIGRTAAVTITGTAGTTQTVSYLVVPRNANVLTITSTGAAWTLTGQRDIFESDYLALTNVVAGRKYSYYAGKNSTDNGGNTDWVFSNRRRASWKRRS